MTKQLLICRLVLLILFVVGSGMIAGGIWGISNVKRIDKDYISTTAKIENIKKYKKQINGKLTTMYDVTVSYEAGGKMCTGMLNTYSSSMNIGDNIRLKYNPREVTEIHSVEIEHIIYVVLIVVGAILLISCLFMPALFRKLHLIGS